MKHSTPQSAGGLASAKIQRAAAENKYLQNPNICLYCHKAIQIKPDQKIAEIRHKKFCNQSCAALHRNNIQPQKIKRTKKCKTCEALIVKSRTYCKSCWTAAAINGTIGTSTRLDYSVTTKADIFKNRANWQSARSQIRRHACDVFNKNQPALACSICGYTKHIEVCHIIAVSDFAETATISEINDSKNLVGLCPNHHWEFDNGLITKEQLTAKLAEGGS